MVKKTKSRAYLTIDDSPSSDFKSKVDYLFSYQIPAIFFCIGEQMEVDPKRIWSETLQADIVYAIKKGFLIGNHSWTHTDFSKLTEARVKAEIVQTDTMIDKLYEKAYIKRPIKVFRFPYLNTGGKNREYAQSVLRDLGYRQPIFKNITLPIFNENEGNLDVNCTYDTMDWTVANPNFMYGLRIIDDILLRMEEEQPLDGKTLNYPHSNNIILMHDHIKIKKAFPIMIERMLAKGIRFEEPGVEEEKKR